MKNLTKGRSGNYYYSRRVPKELVGLLPKPFTDKTYIKFSLGTTSQKTAFPAVLKNDEFYDHLFFETRLRNGLITKFHELTEEQLEMVRAFQAGLPINKPVQVQQSFIPQQAYQNFLQQPQMVQQPDTRLVEAIEKMAIPDTKTEVEGCTIKDAYDFYMAEHKNIADKTKNAMLVSWELFLGVVGLTWQDDISKITKATIRKFSTDGAFIPMNGSIRNEFKGMSVSKQIEHNKKIKGECISNATWNKHMTFISTVMKEALKKGFTNDNPTFGMTKPDDGDKIKRLPYEKKDLISIFNNRIFQEPLINWNHTQWVPMIALFHGARAEEICQLLVTDIKEYDGIHYISITDNDDESEEGEDGESTSKSVKNVSSIRSVPIHDVLIKFGFLQYVERMKGKTRLFPLLDPKAGKYSHDFTKFWSRQKKSLLGYTSSKKVFHSFRHLWKDRARECGISEEESDRISGHTGNGSVGRDYGLGHSVPALKPKIDQIRFDVKVAVLGDI